MADLIYTRVIERSTNEDFDEEFDFDGFIPENTTVTDQDVTITRADGTIVTDDVLLSASHATTIVTLSLRTGSSDTAYIITVKATASNQSQSIQTKLLNVSAPGVYR